MMRIDTSYQKHYSHGFEGLHFDHGLLGDSKIDIVAVRREAGKIIPDGGNIQGTEAGDIRKIVQGTNDFIANLHVLSEDFKKMADRVDQGEGTLGQLSEPIRSVYDNANEVVRRSQYAGP